MSAAEGRNSGYVAGNLEESSEPARHSPVVRDPQSLSGHRSFFPQPPPSYSQPLTYTSFGATPGPGYSPQPPSQGMVNPYQQYLPPVPPSGSTSLRGSMDHASSTRPGSNGQIDSYGTPASRGQASQPHTYIPTTALPAHYLDHSVPAPASADGADIKAAPPKRRRTKAQQPGGSEVEAGMALAEMGLGLNVEGMSAGAKPESQAAPESAKPRTAKKAKPVVESEDVKPNVGQVGKKSCAECRRMKAKCDRVFPCSNCRKRGCALACPDQDLSCMQGKRLVLASTEELHNRIAELEAALGNAHRQLNPTSPHPLLTAEHLDIGVTNSQSPLRNHSFSNQGGVAKEERLSPAQRSSSHNSFVLQTPSSTADHYAERSQSRMAVESLLIDEGNVGAEGRKEDDWVGANAAPALIVGNTSVQESVDQETILHRLKNIVRILPDRETTRHQAARFWSQSTWYQNILRREEFDTVYEPSVYSPTPSNPLTPHKLACVLMLLTLDTYLDVGGSHENPLVGEYWQGVQRCFDTRFGWGASVAGVQALGLASLFVGFGYRGSGASNFYWLRMMTSAAQQLGLHKDPHPSLSPAEQTFRRRVFHEMYTLDCLMSINHGQRTAIPHESIEAKDPDDNMPLQKLKYMYMGHVKSQVIEIGCASEMVTKEELEARVQKLSNILDRYSMERQPEVHCPILTGAPLPPISTSRSTVDVVNLTKSTTSMCHFKCLMFLHRPSLRRLIGRLRQQSSGQTALSDAERNCVQQTFVASTSVIAVSGFIVRHEPRLAARLWSSWVQTFSAAVSLAALAIWCGPYMEDGFIRRAYEEMRGGCEMIRDHGCQRAQGVLSLLPVLCNLVENRYPGLIGSNRPTNPVIQQGEDMLFVLLGGQVDYRQPQQSYGGPSPYETPGNPSSSSLPDHLPPPGSRAIGIVPSSRNTPNPSWANEVSFGPSDPLPTHWLQPPMMGVAGIPSGYGLDQSIQGMGGMTGVNGMVNSHPGMMGQDQQWSQGIDQAEVWARLQTFYEPSMAMPFWNGAQGMGMGALDQGVMGGVWGYDGDQFGTS